MSLPGFASSAATTACGSAESDTSGQSAGPSVREKTSAAIPGIAPPPPCRRAAS